MSNPLRFRGRICSFEPVTPLSGTPLAAMMTFGSNMMLAVRYALAAALPLLISACGDGGVPAVGPSPTAVVHPHLKELRDAASGLAGDWAQRDGHSPTALDGDGLGARDTATSGIADRRLRSDVLYLRETAEWEADGAVARPPADPDNLTFTPVGEARGTDLGMYTARWTTDPGYETTLRLGWGAWLNRSRFGVIRDGSLLEEHGVEWVTLFAYSDGRATRGLQEGGGATYRGVAVAHRTSGLGSRADLASSTARLPLSGLLFGKARIEADFGLGRLDVVIHDMVDIAENAPVRDAGAAWRGIPISHGTMSFRDGASSLDMSFYGRNGAEVGGVFRTDEMVGAFGAGRTASGG